MSKLKEGSGVQHTPAAMACGYGRSLVHKVVDMISGFTGGKAPSGGKALSDRAELEFTFTNGLSHCRDDGWTLEEPTSSLIYLLRKSWSPPLGMRMSSSSSSSSAGGSGPPCAFHPRIDFLEVLRIKNPPPRGYVVDPFHPVPDYKPGDEVQFVKTLGSYALSPSASEVALGTALSAVHTLLRREGPKYIAVIVESRIFGLPEGKVCFGMEEDGSEYPPPFSQGFQKLDLFKEEEGEGEQEVEEQRVRELKRSAWGLKNRVIQEYSREMLAKIQLMGDTWVKANMTLGQVEPLPGGPLPPGGLQAKKRAREE